MILISESLPLSLQILSCFFMAGVISVIQLIHYPSFALIEKSQFALFHLQHSKALGLIAPPAMCLELFSALWIAVNGNAWLILNAIIVVILWCLTFFVSVPAHAQLAKGFDEHAYRRLVKTNWFRFAFWNLRALIFLVIIISFEWKLTLNK